MDNNLCEWRTTFTILATSKLKGNFCDSTSNYINIITHTSSDQFIFIKHELLCYLKKYLQVLHKIQLKYFQISIEKLSVMNFPLAEIETYFPVRFVLFKDIEILPILNIYMWQHYKWKNIFCFELSSKPMLIYMVLHYPCEKYMSWNNIHL